MFGTNSNMTSDLITSLMVNTTLTSPLEGKEFKKYKLFKAIGIEAGYEEDEKVKEKLYTSLAYPDLYNNKPNKLYNIIEEYTDARILSLFGITLDVFLSLSVVESAILVESGLKLSKDRNAAEEDMMKKAGLDKG